MTSIPKVGDRVRLVALVSSNAKYCVTTPKYNMKIGTEMTVTELMTDETVYDFRVKYDGYNGDIALSNVDVEIISSNINNMTLIEKAAVAMKGEPEKSFIRAGVMKLDGSLTEEGQTVFLGYLLNKFGDNFKDEVVSGLLEDSK